jgi:hypothetical protein
VVAAGAQALDSLRLARAFPNDETLYVKCTAQSASMMRQSRSWLTLLRSTQAERKTREADVTAQTTDTLAHQAALDQLTEALADTPPAPPPTQPTPPSTIVEAERYAVLHRKRATLIRSLGRLPDRLSVGHLPPAVAHAIITGTTPILRALGKKSPTPANLAA